MRGRPSVERIKELFVYDGGLRRRQIKPHCRPSDTLGHTRKDGYVRLRVDRHHVFAHHIVWALVHGNWPEKDIDHKDGNRSLNVIENLRLAEPYQNQANMKLSSRNRLGVKGVSLTPGGRYSAMIQKFGKTIYLGVYDTAGSAHAAYCAAAIKYHGEFARFA